MNNLFLEGRPGVGKTTLLRNAANRLADFRIGGFYTSEIREGGARVGFAIETFPGVTGVLAHFSYREGPRVGKYTVDVNTFEKIGVRELERALSDSDIILIDEIGRMELLSAEFRKVVVACLDSNKPVTATIMSRPDPFVDQLKDRSDCRLLKVTAKDREALVERIVSWVKD
ncbi:MAG: NTPase [Dehalococcoidia bacterium]